MKTLKDKMYNYEVAPPSQSWPIIATALDKVNNDSTRYVQKNNKRFYYSLAAAAVTIIICSLFIRLTSSTKKINETAAAQTVTNNQQQTADKITAPETKEENNLYSNTSPNNKLDYAASETPEKKYIIISGPQGQPVKISSKVASLIISSDDQHPPNPVWNAKVNKWRDIMKANILGPATANFIDIVDLTNTLKISN